MFVFVQCVAKCNEPYDHFGQLYGHRSGQLACNYYCGTIATVRRHKMQGYIYCQNIKIWSKKGTGMQIPGMDIMAALITAFVLLQFPMRQCLDMISASWPVSIPFKRIMHFCFSRGFLADQESAITFDKHNFGRFQALCDYLHRPLRNLQNHPNPVPPIDT